MLAEFHLSIVYYDHSPYLDHLEVRPGPIPAPLPRQELTMQNLPEKIIIFYQFNFSGLELVHSGGFTYKTIISCRPQRYHNGNW